MMPLSHLHKKQLEEFVEKGADIEHSRWAGWQEYLFSKCILHTVNSLNSTTRQYEDIPTGNYIIPRELVNRWQRQINTPYSELSEQEKESDRKETRNYLPLVNDSTLSTLQAVLGMLEEGKKEKPSDKAYIYTGIEIDCYNQALKDTQKKIEEEIIKIKENV